MKQKQRQWKAQRDKQRQMQKQRQRVKRGRGINRKKGNSMLKHTQNQRKMQCVKAEANTEAMKVVRVDCRFVMPKLGQSKRKSDIE